jgi:membrane protein YqaA with SNARE-associated domain
MVVSTRVTLFSLLIGIFIAATLVAVAALLATGNPTATVLAAIAGIACVIAVVITYLVGRSMQQLAVEAEREAEATPAVRNRPLTVQSLPVAQLPPEYLAAVMKGVRANRRVLKAGAGDPASLP